MIVKVAGVMVSESETDAFCAGLLESVTLKVSVVAATGAVGVPLMTPAVLRVNPAGRMPEVNCQVYGPMPPVAESA